MKGKEEVQALKTKTKLEEYFESYMKKRDTGADYDDFSTYINKNRGQKATDGAENIILSAKKGTGALATRGLNRTGYEQYLRDKTESAIKEAQKESLTARDKEAQSLANGYLSYLDTVIKKADTLKRTVTGELVAREIVSPDMAFQYAKERGLSDKDAKSAAKVSYATLKTKVQKELMELAVSYKIDGEVARNMALGLGFTEEDAKWIEIKINNLTSRKPMEEESFDRLENTAGKDSTTDIFRD